MILGHKYERYRNKKRDDGIKGVKKIINGRHLRESKRGLKN